jgi:dCMP deaminase
MPTDELNFELRDVIMNSKLLNWSVKDTADKILSLLTSHGYRKMEPVDIDKLWEEFQEECIGALHLHVNDRAGYDRWYKNHWKQFVLRVNQCPDPHPDLAKLERVEKITHCCPVCGFQPIEGMEKYKAIHGDEAKCIQCGQDLSGSEVVLPVGPGDVDKVTTRPSWDSYFLSIASVIATRSTCLRAQYGSVLTLNNRIISTGYNGAPSQSLSCLDKGLCIRDERSIPHGANYEICYSVHSEVNAIIRADRNPFGSTLYISSSSPDNSLDCTPCFMCKRIMINAGVKEVVYGYPDNFQKRNVYDFTADDMRLNERDKLWPLGQ